MTILYSLPWATKQLSLRGKSFGAQWITAECPDRGKLKHLVPAFRLLENAGLARLFIPCHVLSTVPTGATSSDSTYRPFIILPRQFLSTFEPLIRVRTLCLLASQRPRDYLLGWFFSDCGKMAAEFYRFTPRVQVLYNKNYIHFNSDR